MREQIVEEKYVDTFFPALIFTSFGNAWFCVWMGVLQDGDS